MHPQKIIPQQRGRFGDSMDYVILMLNILPHPNEKSRLSSKNVCYFPIISTGIHGQFPGTL